MGSPEQGALGQPSVAIVTLGCGRNDVDSDQLAGVFVRDGMRVVDEAAGADVVIVNTCTFIGPAKQESIDTILAACDLKDDGARAVLVVGCMAERYPDELAAEIPEADAVVGFDGYARLPQLVDDILAGRPYERVVKRPDEPATTAASVTAATPGATVTPAPSALRRDLPLLIMPTTADEAPPEAPPLPDRPETPQDELDRMPDSGPRFPIRRFDGSAWAYLKIASGCDRVCTFCAIPGFRGRFRSRDLDEILAEAAWLVGEGARELVLVSENTTSWGKDLGGRDLQPTLLRELSDIDDLARIRLMYLQPAELQRPLIEAMAALPKVASYFDLSLQHVSDSVLRRMARSGSPERFTTMIDAIRDLDPHAVFRSNFILGFPGETEDDVRQLEDFLAANRLDWVGLFTFSEEDGTPSATMPDQVPADLADERRGRVSELQERLADEASQAFVGRELDVLVEELVTEDGRVTSTVGRSYREAPETDGEIELVAGDRSPADLPVGRTVTARVVDRVGVDLVAEVTGS
ncbi:MAG: 30S ribosomal protein S12 methylthiotransferase RimO [Actinobacteria bacterium]|nr:30S ribosomal protein S12 methylthiotransferase RimO [Actinomycetota bacterium]